MAIKELLPALLTQIKMETNDRELNKRLFSIYEGDLLCALQEKLKGIFSPDTYEELKNFLMPINVFPKVIDKLTKIYQQEPTRDVMGGSESDKELLSWYDDNVSFNDTFNTVNEFFNISKSVLVEPFVDEGQPYIRAITKDRFSVYSKDEINPLKPTHITVILGCKVVGAEKVLLFVTWSKEDILIWDEKLNSYPELMEEYYGMGDGINKYGAIPYIYINKSKNRLTPITDNDTLAMVLELPSQLSWLNMAIGYNCFPINYVIDANIEDLKRAPNVLWRLDSNAKTENQPVIGSIKPQVDIEAALSFIQSGFAMWLNTKGLRPGAIGELTAENAASGVSKMIDESDTTEARKAQVSIFKTAEKHFFDLLFNKMHPYWVDNGLIETNATFSSDARILTNFAEQKPIYSRSEVIANVKQEMELRLESREGAMKRVNPQMSDEQVQEKLAKIDEENAAAIKKAQESIVKPGDENSQEEKQITETP